MKKITLLLIISLNLFASSNLFIKESIKVDISKYEKIFIITGKDKEIQLDLKGKTKLKSIDIMSSSFRDKRVVINFINSIGVYLISYTKDKPIIKFEGKRPNIRFINSSL